MFSSVVIVDVFGLAFSPPRIISNTLTVIFWNRIHFNLQYTHSYALAHTHTHMSPYHIEGIMFGRRWQHTYIYGITSRLPFVVIVVAVINFYMYHLDSTSTFFFVSHIIAQKEEQKKKINILSHTQNICLKLPTRKLVAQKEGGGGGGGEKITLLYGFRPHKKWWWNRWTF